MFASFDAKNWMAIVECITINCYFFYTADNVLLRLTVIIACHYFIIVTIIIIACHNFANRVCR